MEMLNWGTGKNINPYDYKTWGESIYQFDEPTFNILKENCLSFNINFQKNNNEPIQEISMNHSIYTIHFLDKVEQTELITESGLKVKKDFLGEDIDDKDLFDDTKPLTTYLTYSLDYAVEVEICPLKLNNKNYGYPVGYFAWQISKIYAIIFKYYWKEAGVWGHGLVDLYLESIELFKNNKVSLLIGV